MSSTNTVVIDGYLGRDAEVRTSVTGMTFVSFSVAVKSVRKKPDGEYTDRTDWIECLAIGKRGAFMAPMLTRGKFVVVSGALQCDEWEKDGQKRRKTVVFVSNLSLGPRTDRQPASSPYVSKQEAHSMEQEDSDDNIPF